MIASYLNSISINKNKNKNKFGSLPLFGGNVAYCENSQSATETTTPPLPSISPELPTTPIVEADKTKKADTKSFFSSLLQYPNLPNPGTYDNINGSVRRITSVDAFDGLRFELSKQMSPVFQINHFFMIGSSQIPKEAGCGMYSFSATLPHGSQFYTPNGIVNSSIDSGMRVQTRFISQLSKSISSRVTLGLSNSISDTQLQAELDYKGKDFGLTGKYIFGQNIIEANYLQSITSRLAMGCGMMLVWGNKLVIPTVGARYSAKQATFVGTCMHTPQGYQGSLGYVRKINQRASLGAEMNFGISPQGMESEYSVGYEFNLKHATLKGKLQMDGTLMTSVQENTPMGSITFAATMEEADPNKMKFGFGFTFGQG